MFCKHPSPAGVQGIVILRMVISIPEIQPGLCGASRSCFKKSETVILFIFQFIIFHGVYCFVATKQHLHDNLKAQFLLRD